MEYTPRGEINIGADCRAEDGAVERRASDNGTGIEPERLDKVFDKLETDHLHDGGLGLGLTIVKTFVEAHGGRFSVTSQLGQKDAFRFTLSPRS